MEIDAILKSLGAITDISTVIVNFQQFKTKIKAKTLIELTKDGLIIEDILNECFIRKQVLWQRIDYENQQECINSLIQLQQMCDKYSSELLTTTSDEKYFLSQIMRILGNTCNESYKELYRNKGELNYNLAKPLRKLRISAYKVILIITQILPSHNITRQVC